MHKILYRKDRDMHGFQVSHPGEPPKILYRWKTEKEAEKAYHEWKAGQLEVAAQKVTVYDFGDVAKDFIDDADKNKSKWRHDALHWNFQSIILPYFGGNTPITAINCLTIERFIDEQLKRGCKNSTIWHYTTDIAAMYNWAILRTLRHRDGVTEETDYGVISNPVKLANLRKIKNRKVIKPPLDTSEVDKAAKALSGQDRYFFDCLRYTGMRLDEANRLQWADLDLDHGTWVVPGTKTEDSLARLPLAPILQRQLQVLRQVAASPWVFPGRSARTDGKKVYRRTRMFKKIHQLTGIKITAKDLRDCFATEIAHSVSDPAVVMCLLRHTNLKTTTGYLRVVDDRMAAAVKGLGE